MECWILTQDLLFGSQCQSAVQAAGFACATAPSLAQIAAKADPFYFVVIDLSLPRLDIGAAVRELRESSTPPARVLAVGPHVHTGRLEAAREANCDRVLSKGEASQQLANILSELELQPPSKPE